MWVEAMGRVILGGVALGLLIVVAGCGYLMFSEPTAPAVAVEKVIPDDRFAR